MDSATAHLGRKSSTQQLKKAEFDPDPFKQFHIWLTEAIDTEPSQAHAMTLATVNADGHPTTRVMLLRGFDERGFIFYTNYQSRKGRHLDQNPHVAINFHWAKSARQVCIEGGVVKVSAKKSNTYFQRRPRASQLAAWTSAQSQIITGRETLTTKLQTMAEQYQNHEIPRPPHWGGYRVVPNYIEFWQRHPNRLHDRLCYRHLEDDSWLMERLSP